MLNTDDDGVTEVETVADAVAVDDGDDGGVSEVDIDVDGDGAADASTDADGDTDGVAVVVPMLVEVAEAVVEAVGMDIISVWGELDAETVAIVVNDVAIGVVTITLLGNVVLEGGAGDKGGGGGGGSDGSSIGGIDSSSIGGSDGPTIGGSDGSSIGGDGGPAGPGECRCVVKLVIIGLTDTDGGINAGANADEGGTMDAGGDGTEEEDVDKDGEVEGGRNGVSKQNHGMASCPSSCM